jgi:HlyD family secretion protein
VKPPSNVFRKEAIESLYRGTGASRDDVLRISPQATTWTYWLLVVLFLASVLYLVLARIDEHATGAGIIRDEGRTAVTAITSGTIERIAVHPGEKVEANQPLVHFDDRQERIELERLNREFEAQQLNRLKNPNDATAGQQVAALATQIGTAEIRLQQRTLLAPRAGVIQDVRIRSNQFVNPGELLITLAGEKNDLALVAILPGHFRPYLKKGDPLRLEMTGFRYAYQRVTIDEVGTEAVGPNEIRRFLGQEISDSLTLQGPAVIVRAHLSSRTFEAGGRRHEYHDGMQGTAEARVRSESILVSVLPGLRALLENNHE